jgi:hypothetical protein
MDDPDFPLYRRSVNGLNWYRIDSPTEFTEVQRVGNRYVFHQVKAVIYPEKARVLELIAATDDHVAACDPSEFDAALESCGA